MISFTVLPLSQVPELVLALSPVYPSYLLKAPVLSPALFPMLNPESTPAVYSPAVSPVYPSYLLKAVVAAPVAALVLVPVSAPVSPVYPSYLLKAVSQPLLLRLSLNCLLK